MFAANESSSLEQAFAPDHKWESELNRSVFATRLVDQVLAERWQQEDPTTGGEEMLLELTRMARPAAASKKNASAPIWTSSTTCEMYFACQS